MSNAIENARNALKRYDEAENELPTKPVAAYIAVKALRELLDSVAVEHRNVEASGYPRIWGDVKETRYMTPWERA